MAEDDSFSWGRVTRLFVPHRKRVLGVVALVLGCGVLGVINPLLIRITFDDGLFPDGGQGADLRLVVLLCSVMLIVVFVSTILGVVQTIATNRLGQDVLRDLRDRLYSHLHELSLSF